MEDEKAIAGIMATITPAQMHVISRCSEYQDWTDRPNGFARYWTDLVSGRPQCSMKSIHALVARGIMYCNRDGLYGLTEIGLTIQFNAMLTEPARRVGGVG